MRWIALGLLVGCGENPSLRVEVTHPDDASEVIARTTITVYESAIVSCPKVEFGDLTTSELDAIEVSQIDAGSGDELTMSREGNKTIVARGFDDKGVLIAAGCAEQGLVGEGTVLPISTVLAASVSVNGIGLEDNDPFGLVVSVTDPFVRSLPGRRVAWRVHGSDGTVPLITAGLDVGDSEWVPVEPPCTAPNGISRVHPVPPSTTGGFSTTVRTSWSTEPPRVFSTFTPIGNNELEHTPMSAGLALSQRRCALRIAGTTRRLVCLEDRAGVPTAVDYSVELRGGGAVISEKGAGTTETFSNLIGAEVPLNVFAIDRGPTTRDVYAMTTRGRIVGLFSPSLQGEGTDGTPIKTAASATDVTVLPACGSTPAKLLVRLEALGGMELRTLAIASSGPLGANTPLIPYLGTAMLGQDGFAINATGCVAELTAGGTTVHQVGVIDVTNAGARNVTLAVYDCGKTCLVPFAISRAGVGFLPADDTHPERMVGAAFDASGAVLTVGVIQRDPAGEPRLVEQERITAAALPNRVITGSFDGDGLPDLFWDVLNPNAATTNLQLSYAHTVFGERLSALSGTLQSTVVVETLVGDLDGDGNDDVVITSQDKLFNPSSHAVRVLPGQVPIASEDFAPDTVCAAP